MPSFSNPALSARGERYTAIEVKTPEISIEQARTLLSSPRHYGFHRPARPGDPRDSRLHQLAGAVAKLKRSDFCHGGSERMLHFWEKGAESREIPVRHDLQEVVSAYIDAAGLHDAH